MLEVLDRISYRYEPRADHNAQLREEVVKQARASGESTADLPSVWGGTTDGSAAKEDTVGAPGEGGTSVVALEPGVGTGLRLRVSA